MLLLKQGLEKIVITGLDPHLCKYTVILANVLFQVV